MKKIYLVFSLILCGGLVYGQFGSDLLPKDSPLKNAVKVKKHEKEIAAFNAVPNLTPVKPNPAFEGISRAGKEIFIGESTYDLQSNSSIQNRIINHGDGTLSVSWTMATELDWSDRGSGYNYFDGTAWGPKPTSRLEQTRRTGWPSLNRLGNGSDVVISHFSPPPYDGNVLRKGADGTWTEKDMGTMTAPVGCLWPRSTTGGPDGNTIHAIALTTPSGLDGAIYNGMDGHLLYFRSLDGGDTFDKIDVVIPGIDSTQYTMLGGDDYAIHANGNTVAVMVMASWGDVKVMKSDDNGETWAEHIVKDFPLPAPYVEADGYDEAMWPNDTFPSTDGAGTVLVDGNGNVHAMYSEVAVTDDNFGDGSWSFFPGLNSINYWNENMGNDSVIAIASYLDEDGDGLFDVANNEFGAYGQGYASYPSMGMDASGNIFMVYSAISELNPNENAQQGNQHFRRLYVCGSTDGGANWNDPISIITPEFSDDFFFTFIEAVFPSMANLVDDKLHIVYQQDYEPGIAVSGDTDPAGDNFITYTAIPVDYALGLSSTKEVIAPEQINFTITPNPASEAAVLNFELEEAGKVNMQLFNPIGQKVADFGTADYPVGNFSKEISLSGISKGTYVVKLQTQTTVTSKLIVVE